MSAGPGEDPSDESLPDESVPDESLPEENPPQERDPSHDHPDVVLCPGGPMLLRGEHVVQDEDGQEHRTTRPVSAVCRCGASGIKPWCDGTHKMIRKKPSPR